VGRASDRRQQWQCPLPTVTLVRPPAIAARPNHLLHQAAAAILVPRDITAHGAAAAAELFRSLPEAIGMVNRLPWFERVFPTGLPAHLLPVIVERLRGTPARLADRLTSVPHEAIIRCSWGSWSIQENVGHLLDLEPLWQQRVGDLAQRRGAASRRHCLLEQAIQRPGLAGRAGSGHRLERCDNSADFRPLEALPASD
jgi:hypothetical protein